MAKRRMHPNSLKNLMPPIKPGEVRGPRGRKPGRTVSDWLYRLGKKKMKGPGGKDITYSHAIALGIIRAALNPNDKYHFEAIKIFLDRTEGKAVDRVVQELDLTGGAIVPRLTAVEMTRLKAELRGEVEDGKKNGD